MEPYFAQVTFDDMEFHKEWSYGPWIKTFRSDPEVLQLMDRHYSRQTIGSKHVVRPCYKHVVLKTLDGKACWIGIWQNYRKDVVGPAWECQAFRNEGACDPTTGKPLLASDMIRWAIKAMMTEWGAENMPALEVLTYVDKDKVASRNPGYSYKRAGFTEIGMSKKGLILLKSNLIENLVLLSPEEQERVLVSHLEGAQELLRVALRSDWGELEESYLECEKLEQEIFKVQQVLIQNHIKRPLKYQQTPLDWVAQYIYEDAYPVWDSEESRLWLENGEELQNELAI